MAVAHCSESDTHTRGSGWGLARFPLKSPALRYWRTHCSIQSRRSASINVSWTPTRCLSSSWSFSSLAAADFSSGADRQDAREGRPACWGRPQWIDRWLWWRLGRPLWKSRELRTRLSRPRSIPSTHRATTRRSPNTRLLRRVHAGRLPNWDPRDLHEPGQVRPGLHQRRGHEIRPGIPQHLRALVRQRRRCPAPDQDSHLGQRGAEPLDEIARL